MSIWPEIKKILLSAPPSTYLLSSSSMGVPGNVVWRGEILRRANGYSFCSGAAWWALMEVLRQLTDLEEDMDRAQAMTLFEWAWVMDSSKRKGLPFAMGQLGLGVYEEHDRPVEGDVVQIWRRGGSGHTFFCAGYDEHGRLLEWSSSKSHQNGTGIKPVWGTITELYRCSLYKDFF